MLCLFETFAANMATSNDEDIFNDFYLFFYLSNLYGFTSFRIKESSTGRKQLVRQKWCYLLVFSRALQILSCICGCYMITMYLNKNSKGNNGSLFIVLEGVTRFASFISQVICCLRNNICFNKNRKVWQRFYDIEKELCIFKVAINHRILRNLALTCVVLVAFVTSLAVVVVICWLWPEKDTMGTTFFMSQGLYYIYRCGTFCMLICQHVLLFSVLREILLKLRDAAKTKFLLSRFAKPKDLVNIARYHQKICKIAREANSALSVQLLAELLHLFCAIVISSFICVVSVGSKHFRYQNLIIFLVWITFCILYITAMAVFSHECMESVS